MDVQNHEETDGEADVSVRAGFQLESATFKSAKLQLLAETARPFAERTLLRRSIRYFGFGAHVSF